MYVYIYIYVCVSLSVNQPHAIDFGALCGAGKNDKVMVKMHHDHVLNFKVLPLLDRQM